MSFFGEIVEAGQSAWETTKAKVTGAASWAQQQLETSPEKDKPQRFKGENAPPRIGQPVGGAGVANQQVRGKTGNPQVNQADQNLSGAKAGGGFDWTSPPVLIGGALALGLVVWLAVRR
jgi:hypothetical protein